MEVWVINNGKTLHISNQKLYYVELGTQKDIISNDKKEWIDMKSILNLQNNNVLKDMLDNMFIQYKFYSLGVIIGKWPT